MGSSPPWRTRLNLIFSIERLPILEAFFVSVIGQMWTKGDKNRTQNRTQLSAMFLLAVHFKVANFLSEQYSRINVFKILVFFSTVCFIISLTTGLTLR